MARRNLLFPVLAALALAGCPKKGPATITTLPDDSESQPTGKDIVIEMDEQALQGVYFEPQNLPQGVMPGITGKRSIKDQRRRYEKAKPANKVDEGVILVAILWPTPTDRQEALKILQEMAQGGQAPEAVLFMLAIAEEAIGDPGRADAAWEQLITRFPDNKDAGSFRAYRGALALRQHDNARAAKLTAKVDPAAEAVPAELAYVTAWAAFRAGNLARAYQAMAAATRKWRDVRALPGVRRDLLVMGARAATPPDEIIAVLQESAARDKVDMAGLLDALAEAYHYAGEYDERAQVLAKRAEGLKDDSQLAEVRFLEVDVQFRMGRVAKAAQGIIDAWAQVSKIPAAPEKPAPKCDKGCPCGDKCIACEEECRAPSALKEDIAKRMLDMAKVYHSVYAKSFDPAYGDAARKLYDAYLAIPGRPDADKVKKEFVANLDATVADIASFEGVHDKADLSRRAAGRQQELTSCYERFLQADAKLEGKVTLTFDIATEGTVTAMSSEPAAGKTGLAGVAGCVAERVKAWPFPHRKTAGITRVIFPMAFSPLTR